jgi:hypothetical protein
LHLFRAAESRRRLWRALFLGVVRVEALLGLAAEAAVLDHEVGARGGFMRSPKASRMMWPTLSATSMPTSSSKVLGPDGEAEVDERLVDVGDLSLPRAGTPRCSCAEQDTRGVEPHRVHHDHRLPLPTADVDAGRGHPVGGLLRRDDLEQRPSASCDLGHPRLRDDGNVAADLRSSLASRCYQGVTWRDLIFVHNSDKAAPLCTNPAGINGGVLPALHSSQYEFRLSDIDASLANAGLKYGGLDSPAILALVDSVDVYLFWDLNPSLATFVCPSGPKIVPDSVDATVGKLFKFHLTPGSISGLTTGTRK